LCWPRNTLYPQKLALTSPTSGGRAVGIIRSRTKVTEFVSLHHNLRWYYLLCVSFGKIWVKLLRCIYIQWAC
jgi:hypothetical protein